MSYPTIVFFRREKTFAEAQQEMFDGQLPKTFDRWLILAETMMDAVPDAGQFVFINGSGYMIKDKSWSLRSPPDGEPNYNSVHVMLTLVAGATENGFVPEQDFFPDYDIPYK